MSSINLHISLQPKQKQLYDLTEKSKHKWIGYGGSKGGAKSRGVRDVMLLRSLAYRDTRRAILRRTYPLVKENHIDKMLAEYPVLNKWYRASEKEIRFPNNSVLAFRYAETENDVKNMWGIEYMDLAIDQAEQFSEKELKMLRTNCRWPGRDEAECKLLLTFNPGNIGMAFLKRIFIDKRYEGNENADDYAFIQAYGWDNWEWARVALERQGVTAKEYYTWDSDKRFDYFVNHTQTGQDLNALPTGLRIGLLLGHMDKFAGQYFDVFSEERHVAPCRPEPYHEIKLGIDWGFSETHPSVCHWVADLPHQERQKTAFYRERLWRCLSAAAIAQEIVQATPPHERSRVRKIFLSHDAFGKRDERDTIAQQMADVFTANGFPYPERGTTDVAGRAQLMYSMMQTDTVIIDPSCVNLIEVIPMITHDEEVTAKTVKFIGDDAYDSAVHALTYKIGQVGKPRELVIAEEAAKITDPLARWFWLRKHAQKPKPVTIHPNVVMPWQKLRPQSRYVQ